MLDIGVLSIKDKNDTVDIYSDLGILRMTILKNVGLYWTFYPLNSDILKRDIIDIEITKENCYLYYAVKDLYTTIIKNNPYLNGDTYNLKQMIYYRWPLKNLLVDNKIKWYSDEEDIQYANSVELYKKDDGFVFSLVRNKATICDGLKFSYDVVFKDSNSRNYPYNIAYKNFYYKLCNYDYQISFEEYEYNNKKDLIRNK